MYFHGSFVAQLRRFFLFLFTRSFVFNWELFLTRIVRLSTRVSRFVLFSAAKFPRVRLRFASFLRRRFHLFFHHVGRFINFFFHIFSSFFLIYFRFFINSLRIHRWLIKFFRLHLRLRKFFFNSTSLLFRVHSRLIRILTIRVGRATHLVSSAQI